jgi:hypothetical protein
MIAFVKPCEHQFMIMEFDIEFELKKSWLRLRDVKPQFGMIIQEWS